MERGEKTEGIRAYRRPGGNKTTESQKAAVGRHDFPFFGRWRVSVLQPAPLWMFLLLFFVTLTRYRFNAELWVMTALYC